eukprot:2257731-Heterocapsa_arctica.AAC.1
MPWMWHGEASVTCSPAAAHWVCRRPRGSRDGVEGWSWAGECKASCDWAAATMLMPRWLARVPQ